MFILLFCAIASALPALLSVPCLAQAAAGAADEIYNFGAGARALGMGSAQTAGVRDVTALYYNPAGLGLLPGREVSVMRAQLFEGASYDYIGYAQNKKKRAGGWGVELVRLGASGGEGRDELNNETGGFDYSEMGLGVGHGWRGVFHPNLSIGAKLKLLRRSLGGNSDQIFGLDLGAQFGPLLGEKLMVGAVFQNAFAVAHGDTDDKLSPRILAGASYRVAGPLTIAMDLTSGGELRVGTEYAFGMASVRVGMSDRNLSFGGGLKFRRKYTIDLALANHPTLGMSQRFSIGYKFGSALARPASGKSARQESYAAEFLGNGKSELKKRNYLRASKDINTALGIDPGLGKGVWRTRANRLKRLVKETQLVSYPEDQEALRAESQEAFIAYRAVEAYLNGEEDRAMLLAHTAMGTSKSAPAYRRLLDGMAKLTGRKKQRDQIAVPGRLAALKMKQAVEAVYARRFKIASELLREALWLDPTNALAWTRLGSSYFAMGDRQRAKAAWRKALELDPKDEKLRTFMKQQGW